jgi:ABC-type antimicrobial peptide transport system permease subunit
VVGIVSAAAIYMPLNYSNDSYLIVSDDAFNEIGKSTYFQYLTDSKLTLNYNSESQVIQKFISSIGFEIDNTLPNNKLMLPTQMYPCVGPEDDTCIVTGKIDITDVYTSYTVDNLTFGRQATNTGYYRDVIKLNQTTYNRLTNVETYQISLITNTDVGVDGFVVRLRSIGSLLGTGKYDIIYPYRSQSSDSFSAIIQMFSIIGATITVAFTMLASVLISYVIFKAIINTKMHDYAIFRTIGANQKTIKKMIYLENYLTATLGYIIIATVMIILNNGNTFLSDILKYYLWSSYLVLFGMALFMAFSISSRYCRKVFKESVSTTLKTE